MMTTENSSSFSQLPAHFLAYKQKAEAAANSNNNEAPRMGNANCWGSFSFLSSDPRTSITNNNNGSSGIGNLNTNNGNDNVTSSERSYGSSSPSNYNNNASSSSGLSSPSSSSAAAAVESSSKIGAMWNRFSGTIKSTVSGVDNLQVPQTHSSELESKSGFPSNKQMTNVDRLKSMAASAVQKPEIPDAPPVPPAQPQQLHKQNSFPTGSSQSSFPSLASSQSDGSSSLESTTSGSGRFWSMGSKMFGGSITNNKANNNAKATGIGSHQDPSIGELNKSSKASSSSFFPSSMMMMTTTKKVEEKKDIDIEKLKRLRDQAAGLVPSSSSSFDHHSAEEKKEEEKVETSTTLESQIDDLEKEMGMISSTTSAATTNTGTPPHLRMDGFDDVHESSLETPAPAKNYAEIKVTPSAVSHLDGRFHQKLPSNKMISSSLSMASSPPKVGGAGGLSTAL